VQNVPILKNSCLCAFHCRLMDYVAVILGYPAVVGIDFSKRILMNFFQVSWYNFQLLTVQGCTNVLLNVPYIFTCLSRKYHGLCCQWQSVSCQGRPSARKPRFADAFISRYRQGAGITFVNTKSHRNELAYKNNKSTSMVFTRSFHRKTLNPHDFRAQQKCVSFFTEQ
jgi:hypothetical protein